MDILIFGETKLDSSYPTSQLLINGFKRPFRLDRNSRGGGVLIYVRTDIPCKQLDNHDFPEGIEGIFVEINLRKSKWLLLGTYHPPSQKDNFYFKNVARALDIYTPKYDKILLTGDFNAEEEEAEIKNFMELYDLKNLVKEKTCFKSVQNPSCVDLFLTNCNRSFQHTSVVSTGISDCHKMIVTVLKTTFKKAKPKEIVYRCYKNFDRHNFRRQLKHELQGCNTQYEEKFLAVLNFHAPLKKKVVRANEVPYMTKALRKAIAPRSKLENRYYKCKTVETQKAYKRHKNFCSRLYKKERKRYYINLDVKKVSDNKSFWKTIKPFLSDKGTGKDNITLIEGDKIVQDDTEIAEIMNECFGNAVASLNLDIPIEYTNNEQVDMGDPIENIVLKYSNHPSIKLINKNVAKDNFSFKPVSVVDIEKQVRALNINKSTMSNSIPPKILKENQDICCEPLTNVINYCIENCCFNSELKLADLTPVHKNDDTTNKKNYRNVSLLPVVSKICEKVLQSQISAHVDKFLSPYLCGYRQGFSAQHALVSMLEKWQKSVDKGGFGGGILMDLSKAFDTLNHDLLIAKLHTYGFDKDSLKLLKSYLSDRWQRTKINNSFSSWKSLLIGVPQGSVLGPLLFNLFINDLFYIIKCDLCNYADDNTPYACDLSLKSLMDKLECASDIALDWFRSNGMKLNSSKCKLLVCGHKFENMICKIENDNVIETHMVKLLGIEIDSKLTFSHHVNTLCKKVSQKLNALSRLCKLLPFYRRKMLMQAFFNSQFSYCPLVWMFHNRQLNTRINNLHYRALRMVYQDQVTSFEELLCKDGSVAIHHRNLQFLATELYKVNKGIGPSFMEEIFPKNPNANSLDASVGAREKSTFYNFDNTKKVYSGLETLRCLGPKVWDMIPKDVKNIDSLILFKNKIKNWIPKHCPCRLCKIYIKDIGFL